MAYTVIDSKNISKTKNIYTFGGSGTKPERDDIAENSKLTDYSSGEKFYYDPTKAAGNKWQPDKEPSGGSSGGGLPINFPAEGAANANKYIGFDASGNYTAKEGGSGGGQFVVTFSDVDLENMTIGLPDKTGEEIHAALQANTPVVASLAGAIYLPLIQQNYESATAFAFTFAVAAGSSGLLTVDYGYDSSEKAGINIMIPAHEPLIVNLTEDKTDPEHPAIVGDKTYGEIADAFASGKNICIRAVESNEVTAFSIVFAEKHNVDGADMVTLSAFLPDHTGFADVRASDYFRIDSD